MTELTILPEDRYERLLTPGTLGFVAELVQAFAPGVEECLAARERRQIQIDRGEWPDLRSARPETLESIGPITNTSRYAKGRCVEVTGPPRLEAIRAAAAACADGYVVDIEDGVSPRWDNLMSGQACLKQYIQSGEFAESQMSMWLRPRSWHALEPNVTIRDKPIPGALLDFGIYLFGNAGKLKQHGRDACFSLPKIESHEEARLWSDIFEFSASHGVCKGVDIKAILLVETVPAILELDEIMHELRDHVVGLACDHTDYAFSFAKSFHGKPRSILPDRIDLTSDTDFLRAYERHVVGTCQRNGIPAIGVTDNVVTTSDDEANHAAANQVVVAARRSGEAGFNVAGLVDPGLLSAVRDATSIAGDAASRLPRSSLDNVAGVEALLHITGGRITESGVRRNIYVIPSWSWPHGWQDAARVDSGNHRLNLSDVELSRMQLWQWVQHATGILDEGRNVDYAFVNGIIGEVLDELCASSEGACDEDNFRTAAKILRESLLDEVPQPFLLNSAIAHLRH